MKPLLLCCSFLVLSVSCSSDYYTADDFTSVKKIDTHMHLNDQRMDFAEQAKEDNFHLLAVNVDVPKQYPPLDDQQRFALMHEQQYPDQIDYLTAFTLEGWDSATWNDKTISRLKDSFSKGALGIKIWKNIGMVYKDSTGNFIMIDNPRFDSLINYIVKEGRTVMGHLGEPKNCWLPVDQMTVNNDRNYFKNNPEYHMYLHPEYSSYEDQINARDHFLERHPDMRFVGAHLGSLEWDVVELAKRLDKFPNMAVDVAARIPHLQFQSQKDREKIRNFIITYQDRLVYGSDSEIHPDADAAQARKDLHNTWMRDWKYFVTDETLTDDAVNGSFQGLKLPKAVVDKLYHDNAVTWFKIKY